ncbi:MFS transporter, AAHS family, 3-hydroxyphenylpropionic acid transporter [Rhizobium sp. RU35A]|uniref:MFS transporter n=1 Tax=Rhizobium sp. RU35A TaxID=1907414 RepID=UPI000956A243|nr:MFS transporter [Rhizobium sp. RU35A]SIQ18558.1 MFS transporter, AAHS family, 3-hydroxyphenylpropionic acid transporter [Rhizobium sp. RU35A]
MTKTAALRTSGGRALVLAFLAAVIEGFDLQAAGVAVPKLAPAFGLTPPQIGLFLSSATFGLIFGSLSGGWIADTWGRRAGLVLSLLTFGVFSVATVFATSFEQLLVLRILTGVGLGGALPNLINIAAESVEPRRRGWAVSIMYAGVPLGGAIASGVATLGLHGGDWHMIFLVGGLMPLVLAPFVQLLLPPLAVARQKVSSATGGFAKLVAPESLVGTLFLWLAFFLGLMVVYVLLNWMPQLLVARGLEKSEASLVQLMFNVGGVAGSLIGGRIFDSARPIGPVLLAFAASAAALIMLGILPVALALMLVGGALVGAAILCMQAILYATAPQCYPFEVRGTGVGIAVAVGRLGSIAGPLFTGLLVARGATPTDVMFSLVPLTVLTGVFTVVLLFRRSRREAFA